MKPAFSLRIVLFLAIAAFGVPCLAQDYVPDTAYWETRASMNQIRSYFPGVAVNGKIYAFGGIIGQNSGLFILTNQIEEYDISADTWTVKGTLPQSMYGMAAVELDGAVYIIGGSTHTGGLTATDKVYRYFPASGTFDADTIASLPAPRGFLSACVSGGKIYVLGGADGFLGNVKNDVYEYDPALNVWITHPTGLTVARATHTSAVVNGKIYVIGGTPNWSGGIASVEVFDPGNPGWQAAEPLSQARALHGSAVINGIIFALGGIDQTLTPEITVEAFEPANEGDKWEVFKNLTYDRRAFGCVAWPPFTDDLSYLYAFGGNSGSSAIAGTQRLAVGFVGASEPGSLGNGSGSDLLQVFPNPFDQAATLTYQITASTRVVISVYNANGQLVAQPVNQFQQPGAYRTAFDGSNLEPGLYICRFTTGTGAVGTLKMVVVR